MFPLVLPTAKVASNGRYMPWGQMQASGDLDAGCFVTRSLPHWLQVTLLAAEVNRATGQLKHMLLLANSEYWPGWQLTQAMAPASLMVPGLQAMQAVEPRRVA